MYVYKHGILIDGDSIMRVTFGNDVGRIVILDAATRTPCATANAPAISANAAPACGTGFGVGDVA